MNTLTIRLLLSILFYIGITFPSLATHIVGGNLNLKHLRGNQYELSLIIYFDEINGNHQAIDRIVPVSAFSKNHEWIETFHLALSSQTPVAYKYPKCAIPEIITTKIVYKNTITLSANTYNNENGYYLSFERCCRNATIVNIEEPEFNGQTFYLEFPAVIQKGQRFINSSPQFKDIANNYACLAQPFSFDFGANDADGDQLKYSLSTPLEGNSSPLNPLPTPQNGPYPEVTFTNGHNIQQMIKGTPALSIHDENGLLTVMPSETGLFVFSVKCEEFRDGKKIGELRRDFQILVTECETATPPMIESASSNHQTWENNHGEITIHDIENMHCFKVQVYDPDSEKLEARISHTIGIDSDDIRISNQKINTQNHYAAFEICIENCFSNVEEIGFQLHVYDESCSQPLQDQVWIDLSSLDTNHAPDIQTSLEKKGEFHTLEILVNQTSEFHISVSDLDLDSLNFHWNTSTDTLALLGISPSELSGKETLAQNFQITPHCQLFSGDALEHLFYLEGIAQDIAECGVKSETKIQLEIKLLRPQNTPMKLSTDLVYDEKEQYYTFEIGSNELKTISILGEDDDDFPISIKAYQQDMNFAQERTLLHEIKGMPQQNLQLSIMGDCSLLRAEDAFAPKSYIINVEGKEYDDCGERAVTSLKIKVTVFHVPTENTMPFVNLEGANTSDSLRYQKSMFIDDFADFSLHFSDQEKDDLYLKISSDHEGILELIQLKNQPLSDHGILSFSLDAVCSLIPKGKTDHRILLTFEIVEDKKCNHALSKKIELELHIQDYLSVEKTFPNAFSPNGDGKGDTFYLHHVLPLDNCQNFFQEIQIVNRWGEPIYSSTNRQFEWDASHASGGTYYYVVKFNHKNFKGSVQVFK